MNDPSPPAIRTLTSVDRYQQSLEFLYNRLNYERQVGGNRYPFGLRRITDLIERLDLGAYLHQPGIAPRVPLVHVAGTKGKGSTCTMVASVLAAAGFRTGLYSSPHLHRLEERFRVNGLPCTPEELIDLVDRVRGPAADMEARVGSPSFFELTTAIAMLYFDSMQCDAIVLEVGLGGRLDSTNFCAPSVTAVTSIGFDHQHVLGYTLEAIAGEKAGIIKPGVPVVSGVTQPEAAAVIRAKADSVAAPLFQLGEHFDFSSQSKPDWGSSVTVVGRSSPLADRHQFELSMEGRHQSKNAAIATTLIDLLKGQGRSIPESALDSGMATSQCLARIERWKIGGDRWAIIDSAHNEDSIGALSQTLRARCPDRPITIVFGTSNDKAAEPMLDQLSQLCSQLVLTRFLGNPRFRNPDQLFALLPDAIAQGTEVIDDPLRACEVALAKTPPGGTLVICGSFFLAAECRHWVIDQSVSTSH